MKTRTLATRTMPSTRVSLFVSGLVWGATALAPVGCAIGTGSDAQESTAKTTEALPKGTGPVGPMPTVRLPPPPPPPPPVRLAFPPASPLYCPAYEPACSVDPISWVSDEDPALAALGCSHEQHWFTGNSSGLLGGIFTLCPNTAAVRAKYGQAVADGVVNTCSACIPQAPPGDVYVLIEAFLGPNCESGCLTHPYKPITGVPSDDGVTN